MNIYISGVDDRNRNNKDNNKDKIFKIIKEKAPFLIVLFFALFTIILLAIFKNSEKYKDIKLSEKYFKTNIRKIDKNIKKVVKEKKDELLESKYFNDDEKAFLKERLDLENNNEEVEKKEETEESKKNKEELINKLEGKIENKSLRMMVNIFSLGELSFLKYNIYQIKDNLISEDIRIYTFIGKKQVNVEDFLSEEYKEEMYKKLEIYFDEYSKNEENILSLRKIHPDKTKNEILINKIKEEIKNRNFLKNKSLYIDEQGMHVFLENNIKYLAEDKKEMKKEEAEILNEKECENLEDDKCFFNEFNFKLLIPNEEIYLFLKEEHRDIYLKKIEGYKLKCEAKMLKIKEQIEKKRIEKEKEIKEQRAKMLEGKKYIALSFDDGPGEYTKYFLDKLKEKNVKTTFFVLGHKLPGHEAELKQMVEDGHDIGNHSYNHANFALLKKEDALGNIHLADAEIKKVIGFAPKYLRPPYGARNKGAENESGKEIILWNYDPLDWKYRDVEKVKNEIMNMPENALAVMHDIHKTTVDAVLNVIDEKRKEGYEFVTVTELLEKIGT